MKTEEAFLGQRWSVRDVLLHLDSERYVDALEKIARGEMEMLPPFSSREEHFRQELEQQEAHPPAAPHSADRADAGTVGAFGDAAQPGELLPWSDFAGVAGTLGRPRGQSRPPDQPHP